MLVASKKIFFSEKKNRLSIELEKLNQDNY